jgi:type VI secretion system protein ImpH
MADDPRTATGAVAARAAQLAQARINAQVRPQTLETDEPADTSVVRIRRAISLTAELPVPVVAPPRPLEIDDLFGTALHGIDFFEGIRRLERLASDQPRLGEAPRAAEEPIRLGQEPSLAFASSTLARYVPAADGGIPRLTVNFFGVFGPNGPLPLHLPEYARQRVHHHNDPTFARFADVFHHRLLSLFYRAWAASRPAVQRDRPESDRFGDYVGTLIGRAGPSLNGRDALPDDAKLYYAGRLSHQPRNAEGLRDVISDYFEVPTQIEEFHGEWVSMPPEYGWKLGGPRLSGGALTMGEVGYSAILGPRVWSRQHKFRIVLGPLRGDQFQRLLPGTQSVERLVALVRNYIGDELSWDLRLTLQRDAVQPQILGKSGKLGQTSWLLGENHKAQWDDLVFDPQRDNSPQDVNGASQSARMQ